MTYILAFLLLVSTQAFAAPIWQQSQSGTIELGIRDKFGELKGYDAVFIVKSERTYKISKHVKDDEFAMVVFPNDFKAEALPGKYTWKCLVGGKVVGRGDFRI